MSRAAEVRGGKGGRRKGEEKGTGAGGGDSIWIKRPCPTTIRKEFSQVKDLAQPAATREARNMQHAGREDHLGSKHPLTQDLKRRPSTPVYRTQPACLSVRRWCMGVEG